MTLGEQLKTYMRNKGDLQKTYALEWLERWEPEDGRKPARDTVTTNLSRCVKDVAEGVRFFFDDDRKAHLLFDVLRIPDSNRGALLDEARAIINGTQRPARLVVDLSSWPCAGDAATQLFEDFKTAFLEPSPQPFPIVLFVTEQQYDRLPRSFDDHEQSLQVERCKNGSPDILDIQRRAGDAVIASSRRLAAYDRWIALDHVSRGFVMDPPDGPQALAREGRLSGLPTPPHSIPDSVTPRPKPPALPTSPLDIRKLMRALAIEAEAESLEQPRETRRAWAATLGVPAASTERERIEDELAAAAAAAKSTPTVSTAVDLARLQARASRRPVEPTALRVGDELHLVNPTDQAATAAASHPRIQIHRYVAKTPALTRILEDLKTHPWSYDDLLDDPFLARYAQQMTAAADTVDAANIEHAIGTLALDGAIQPTRAPEPIDDWKAALTRLVERDPPPAWVLLDARDTVKDDKKNKPSWPFPFWAPDDVVAGMKNGATPFARARVPVGDLLLQREDCSLVELSMSTCDANGARFAENASDNVDLWMDLVEYSPACGGVATPPRDSWDVQSARSPHGWHTRGQLEFDWSVLDRDVGAVWLLLRRALQSSNALRLHDGTVVLHVGTGLVAEITLRHPRLRRPRPAPIAAVASSFTAGEDKSSYPYRPIYSPSHTVDLVTARATLHYYSRQFETMAQVAFPRSLYLSDDHAIAEVRFAASPMLGDVVATAPSRTITAVHAAQAAQAIAQNEDDD